MIIITTRWWSELSLWTTVEPLLKYPPRKGQPLYKGHFQYPQGCICNKFQPPKRGQPPYKGQNGWSQSVPYSEVPLYYQDSGVHILTTHIVLLLLHTWPMSLSAVVFIDWERGGSMQKWRHGLFITSYSPPS